MPLQTMISLSTPCVCNSTIHDVVRTSSDVQNGNSTKIINKFECLSGKLASKYDIGKPSTKHATVTMILIHIVRMNKST